jgi:predicted XRE-type DNA-binding protein
MTQFLNKIKSDLFWKIFGCRLATHSLTIAMIYTYGRPYFKESINNDTIIWIILINISVAVAASIEFILSLKWCRENLGIIVSMGVALFIIVLFELAQTNQTMLTEIQRTRNEERLGFRVQTDSIRVANLENNLEKKLAGIESKYDQTQKKIDKSSNIIASLQYKMKRSPDNTATYLSQISSERRNKEHYVKMLTSYNNSRINTVNYYQQEIDKVRAETKQLQDNIDNSRRSNILHILISKSPTLIFYAVIFLFSIMTVYFKKELDELFPGGEEKPKETKKETKPIETKPIETKPIETKPQKRIPIIEQATKVVQDSEVKIEKKLKPTLEQLIESNARGQTNYTQREIAAMTGIKQPAVSKAIKKYSKKPLA